MVGVPEFKWLEKYQQLIGRKSIISLGEYYKYFIKKMIAFGEQALKFEGMRRNCMTASDMAEWTLGERGCDGTCGQ